MNPTHEMLLDMWNLGYNAEDIAETLDIHRDTVFYNLRVARDRGDRRAARREREAPAMMNRARIFAVASTGAQAAQIARVVGLSKRTVQLHLRAGQEA